MFGLLVEILLSMVRGGDLALCLSRLSPALAGRFCGGSGFYGRDLPDLK